MSSLDVSASIAGSADRGRESSAFSRRWIAAAVFAPCAVVLALAAWLEPSPTGMGTHERLGLPPCNWIMAADLPCPTCGMTTAFAHAANGSFIQAFLVQPLGCILAVFTAMVTLVCIHVMITGSRLGELLTRMFTRKAAWTLAAMVVLAWVFTIVRHKAL